MKSEPESPEKPTLVPEDPDAPPAKEKDLPVDPEPPREIGGRKGPEPTRYGDWEQGGKCVDF